MMDEVSLLSFHLLLMPLLFKFILSHVCTVFNLFYLIPCHYVAWWAGIKLYELNLFLLSASIWHEHCLILSFGVIDYSFDWFCFTGHALNEKEIKLVKHKNWLRLKSKLMVCRKLEFFILLLEFFSSKIFGSFSIIYTYL